MKAKDSSDKMPAHARDGEPTCANPQSNPLRLLMVEDSPRDTELVIREIRRGGFDLTWKRVDTEAAMKAALDAEPWDAVVSDYIMPHFDGLGALRVLREKGIDIPFILISGTIGEDTAVEAMKAGAHDYLMKNNLVRLVPAIERELRVAAARRKHRQAEDQIERLSRFPLENPNPVLRISTQGILEYANAAATPLLPLMGAGVGDAVHAEWQAHIDDSIAKAHPIDFEFQAEGRAFEVTATPIIDHGYVNLYARDITSQKKAEDALRKKERLLSESQRLGHVGSWMIEADGQVVFSDEMYRMLGVSPDTFDTTMESFIALIHPDDRHWMRSWSKSCAAGEHPAELEFRINRSDGTVRFILGRGELALDERTQTAHMAGSAQDITERKQAEEENNNLQVQLTHAQKMESVGRLAGGVAHDFNNMLSIILGHVGLALDLASPTGPLLESLLEIQGAANRSADLTRQLLAFARKQDIAPKILNLNDAVPGMLKMLQRLIGEDINLVWRPGAELRTIKIDPSQIDQILANLCVNARDAIDNTGTISLETGNVVIDADYCAAHTDAIPGAYVFIAVSDTGCGMEQETLAQIFEPFFTTKEVGKGTGLGLATVYGIAKQNNGFIYAYSEPGQGTTFKIYLPQAERKIEPQNAPAPVSAPNGRGETILLVEDNPALQKVYKRFFDGLGYTLLSAESPEEALRLSGLHPEIHLLLTDVVMPGMNGRELADKIRESNLGIQVLFMSGYTADILVDRGVREDHMAFIAKPFSRDELADKLRTLLDARPSTP
ncbi:MAG: response regulator [Kiritimatiellales bacterium]|nr:response regulator [Kiritimatiellales bacterium]